MAEIQSNRQLWGKDFPIGGEPRKVRGTLGCGLHPTPHMPLERSGRWTVKREETRFTVVFHRFQDGQEILLAECLPTEAGEIKAKTCAPVCAGRLHAHGTNQIIPNTKE